MSVADVEIVQLCVREDKGVAGRGAAHASAWVLTGEDPAEIMAGATGQPRHFATPGAAVLWLHSQMKTYNASKPHTLAGYDIHLPDGEVRILRPGKPVSVRKGNGSTATASTRKRQPKLKGEPPPTERAQKFGSHEWTKLKTPVYVREGYSLYECGLCGLRVRTSEKEASPGIPGTCPRNVAEGKSDPRIMRFQ